MILGQLIDVYRDIGQVPKTSKLFGTLGQSNSSCLLGASPWFLFIALYFGYIPILPIL